MARYRSFKDIDWTLLVLALIICGLGVLQIYSATHDTKLWQNDWWKQIIWICSGLGLMWLVISIDYHTLLGQTPLLYAVTVGTLFLTDLIGRQAFGSKRWITLGGVNFQISEFAKLVIVLIVARFLSELKRGELRLRDLVKLGGLVGIPTVLVMLQPDLGTSLTYIAILGAGILLAGIEWRYLAAIGVACALAGVSAYPFLKPYQKDRIATFFDPGADPLGAGYQVMQSRIAVGNGGMWGAGATHGTQTQLRFLPVTHTDFIFSGFAEEHGFVAVVLVLGLYFLLVMQIVQNAQTASDRSGMYICMGVAALLLFHVLVNVGMDVGSMVVTGIPLPLMSYGGSNLFSVFMMLGLVNNVRLRRL